MFYAPRWQQHRLRASMNLSHFHLIITHVPVLGTFFGVGLLLFGWLRRNEEFKRVALLVFVVDALMILPAYLSGPSAADLIGGLMRGMTMDAGDQHAEVAILALAGSLATGIVSLAGLVLFRKVRSVPSGFLALVLLLALLSGALLGWTANLGGRIRHLEIRPQSSA